jgi:hypothetical protein
VGGQSVENFVDHLLGRERAGAHSLLCGAHRVTHPSAAQAALRLGEARVGEQCIGLWNGSARIRVHAS